MKAMVLAAGLGTRLRPLTELLPKPLVPVANVPLLEHIVRFLARQGIRGIAVNLHHLPGAIPARMGDGERFGVELAYSAEEEILGTAGGMARLRDYFAGEEYTLLANGDCIQDFDLAPMLAAAARHKPAAVLLVRPDPDGLYTPIHHDGAGRLTAIGGGANGAERTMFAGVHLVAERVLDLLPERGDIVRDVYMPMLERGDDTIRVVASSKLWHDLGGPESYLAGTLAAIEHWAPSEEMLWLWAQVHPDSDARRRFLLAADCDVGLGTRLRECVIGPGVAVGEGARIRRALVWGGSRIGEGAELSNVIVAAAEVPPGTRIDSACVMPGPPGEPPRVVPFDVAAAGALTVQ